MQLKDALHEADQALQKRMKDPLYNQVPQTPKELREHILATHSAAELDPILFWLALLDETEQSHVDYFRELLAIPIQNRGQHLSERLSEYSDSLINRSKVKRLIQSQQEDEFTVSYWDGLTVVKTLLMQACGVPYEAFVDEISSYWDESEAGQ